MPERVGLVGFVNTEEILADTIRRQTPDVVIDGYEVIPNEAFGRAVNNRYPLYGVDDSGQFGFHHLDRLEQIPSLGYTAVNLGPIPAAFIGGETLDATGYDYIGPRRDELAFELDKTKISDIFPADTDILPPTRVVETDEMDSASAIIDELGGNVVLKFVGEYPKYYDDSETRRVRLIGEFAGTAELSAFVRNSVADSGKVVIQKFIDGQQFSFTCLVDRNEGIVRIGENICYKHRDDGETGPLCDGTGSLTIGNTLPELVTPDDIDRIQDKMVRPYVEHLGHELGQSPKTFLNLDLIKDRNGTVYLLEVNHREPGGHTMANLLSGLDTPLVDLLQATQESRLGEISPRFKNGASVVVSAYPSNFPHPFSSEDERPTVIIPKLQRDDDVRIYTGWVDVLDETDTTVEASTQLSPTMLFVNHAPSLERARRNVYERIQEVVPPGFEYRSDIGLL